MSTMKSDLWGTVHRVFCKFDEFFGVLRSPQRAVVSKGKMDFDEEEEELLQAPQDSQPRALDDLLGARTALRGELDVVKASLAEHLSERDVYLVIFPIVAHFDELVQTRFLAGDKLSWPTLQRELFQVDDAGELFFDTLDDILMKPQTFPFVLEVFYFCLKDGFVGRHNRNPNKVEEYMERLANRIPVEEANLPHRDEEKPVTVPMPSSPLPYYLSAVGLVALCFGILMAVARLWNPLLR